MFAFLASGSHCWSGASASSTRTVPLLPHSSQGQKSRASTRSSPSTNPSIAVHFFNFFFPTRACRDVWVLPLSHPAIFSSRSRQEILRRDKEELCEEAQGLRDLYNEERNTLHPKFETLASV